MADTTTLDVTSCKVVVDYIDTTRISKTEKGNLSFKDAKLRLNRVCDSLRDARGFIVAVRQHAAHAQNIALMTITVYADGRSEPIWGWYANPSLGS